MAEMNGFMEGVSYGLRDKRTGRLARLACGEAFGFLTYHLVVKNHPGIGDEMDAVESMTTPRNRPSLPAYETIDPADIGCILASDRPEKTVYAVHQPSIGNLHVEHLEVVKFTRTFTYGGAFGSDPISEKLDIEPHPLVGI